MPKRDHGLLQAAIGAQLNVLKRSGLASLAR
jgi:hypothetical protein